MSARSGARAARRSDPPAAAARQGQGCSADDRQEHSRHGQAKATKPVGRPPTRDHEVITPHEQAAQGDVRQAIAGEDDPVARAEEALAQLAGEFSTWMDRRMRAARPGAAQASRPKASRKQPTQACSTPPTTSRAKPATFGYPGGRAASPTACAGWSSIRRTSPAFRWRWSISTSTPCARSCASMPAPTTRRWRAR